MDNLILNCIIVDDEPMALNLVESYVKKTPFLDLKNKFNSAIESIVLHVNCNSRCVIFRYTDARFIWYRVF